MITETIHNTLRDWPSVSYAGRIIDSVEGEVYPEEIEITKSCVHKRVREFSAGRILAREAWKHLGIPPAPLLRDRERCPVWPQNLVGSISHTDDYCGVIVGKASLYQGIGFDIELISRIREPLWPTFCTAREMHSIHQLPRPVQQTSAALIFSAKESFYKCHFFLYHLFFLFHALEIQLDHECGYFYVSILDRTIPSLPPEKINTGLFSMNRTHVFTVFMQK
jgi:4'-phosphopantetheinyl transferase EntD